MVSSHLRSAQSTELNEREEQRRDDLRVILSEFCSHQNQRLEEGKRVVELSEKFPHFASKVSKFFSATHRQFYFILRADSELTFC
jgi:hypothetical protein